MTQQEINDQYNEDIAELTTIGDWWLCTDWEGGLLAPIEDISMPLDAIAGPFPTLLDAQLFADS